MQSLSGTLPKRHGHTIGKDNFNIFDCRSPSWLFTDSAVSRT